MTIDQLTTFRKECEAKGDRYLANMCRLAAQGKPENTSWRTIASILAARGAL